MDYRKLGICKFILFGTQDTAQARVDIEAHISDPIVSDQEFLLSQSWLLMLESQIGKVPKKIQDLILDTLSGQTIVYFRYSAIAPQLDKTPDMRHLATLDIELCVRQRPFVLAHPRDFDRHIPAEALAGLIIVNSFPAVCSFLKGENLNRTLYLLIYGLHKWETEGRPGWITAFTQTWYPNSIQSMVDQGWQLIQQGWMTKLH